MPKSNNTLVMVGLKMDHWDFLTLTLDICHSDAIENIKKLKEANAEKVVIDDQKHYASYLEEIMEEIADQLADATIAEQEMIEG